jgi:uncharacterized SAM-binding protein YcdF (DUF218 family)
MNYDAGIILGHFYCPLGFSSRQKKRMEKGIELYNSGHLGLLITTGGKGSLFNCTSTPLGTRCKQYLVERGIPPEHIISETQSKNTVENAKNTREILKEKNIHSAVIITSADHMLRAKQIFGQQYPKDIKLGYAISDHFSGVWSIWDSFWHLGARTKSKLTQ